MATVLSYSVPVGEGRVIVDVGVFTGFNPAPRITEIFNARLRDIDRNLYAILFSAPVFRPRDIGKTCKVLVGEYSKNHGPDLSKVVLKPDLIVPGFIGSVDAIGSNYLDCIYALKERPTRCILTGNLPANPQTTDIFARGYIADLVARSQTVL